MSDRIKSLRAAYEEARDALAAVWLAADADYAAAKAALAAALAALKAAEREVRCG